MILSLVAKKYSSKLDIISLIYSYLCREQTTRNTTMSKYKEYGYDIQNGKAIIPEWETEIKEIINL